MRNEIIEMVCVGSEVRRVGCCYGTVPNHYNSHVRKLSILYYIF